MMPPGVETEKFDVEHMRKTSNWKPVRGFSGRERPGDSAGRNSLPNVEITGDIIGIVKIDEIVGPDLEVYKESRDGKNCVD